jgi:hypothetical protein
LSQPILPVFFSFALAKEICLLSLNSPFCVQKQRKAMVKKIEFSTLNILINDIMTMYNEFTTDSKEEGMLLIEEDTYPANDVEMLSAEESDEHVHSFPAVNARDNFEKVDDILAPLRTFMDVDPAEAKVEGSPVDIGSSSESQSLEPKQTVAKKPNARESYRRYTLDQIEKLFDLVIEEGKTAKEAALITGINLRTAQHYVKRYNDDEERRLPGGYGKPRVGRLGKFFSKQYGWNGLRIIQFHINAQMYSHNRSQSQHTNSMHSVIPTCQLRCL